MAKLLSIEIDNFNIKIIEAIKKGETLSICRCLSVNVDHSVKDGKIIDMNLVGKKIREVLIKNNIKTKSAVFVINSSSIMIRTIKLPLLKKNREILSMIQIELQQMVSADLAKYKIVYEISNVINENKTQYADYIVYCVPMILVNQHTELAQNLNLKLIKIDISPLCINTLFKNNITVNDNNLNIKETIAFINLRENMISFSVANNGFCDFYSISKMERTYIDIAAEPQSAYVYLESYQNAHNTTVSQIVKFMRYYYSVSSNKIINKIYIYGTYSLETIKEIKTKLNIDVEIISSISNLELDENIFNVFEINNYFNVTMALFSIKSINFYATSKKRIRNNYGFAVISVIIIIACIVLFGFVNSQFGMRNKIQAMTLFIDDGNNNEINNKIENIKIETDYLEKYLKSAEMLEQVIKEIDCVDSSILRKINMAIPSETKVTSIYLDKASTQLQCVSPSMSEITLFFSNLREIEQIENVYIPAIQSKTGQEFSYSVVIQLKDVIENDN